MNSETTLQVNNGSAVSLLDYGLRSKLMQEVEKFTSKLNESPKEEWLQLTPDKKAKYIPIEILEIQLAQDFAGLVQFQLISERRELNEFIVVARIMVFHPILMQWLSYDGIGASQITQNWVKLFNEDGTPLKDDKGYQQTRTATLQEFNDTKQPNALQMNSPKAYAEAIKNAAKKIGKKYGASINRKFEDHYEPEYTLQANLDEVIEQLKKCDSRDDLTLLWSNYPELHTSNRFKSAFTARRVELAKTEKEPAL